MALHDTLIATWRKLAVEWTAVFPLDF